MAETLPWNLPLPQLLAELGAPRDGLSSEEVRRRLAKYGPNDALLHRRRPLWRQVLDRFANPLILNSLVRERALRLDRRGDELRANRRYHPVERGARRGAAGEGREHGRRFAPVSGTQGRGAARRKGPRGAGRPAGPWRRGRAEGRRHRAR